MHTEPVMKRPINRGTSSSAGADIEADANAISLDASLAFSSYSLWLAMNKFYLSRLKALDLTFPQYLVMQTLWEAGSLTVSGIGRRLSLNSGTLSPILQRMEELGLIERIRNSGDERTVDVFLSEYGSNLRAHALAMESDIGRAMELPPHQRKAMQANLAEIRNSIPSLPRPAQR